MKKLVLMILSISLPLWAQIPQTINYQGKLTDPAGVAIEGTRDIVFSLYNDVSTGTLLWTESHSGVPVVKGLFDVVLGELNPLNLPFDTQYWMELDVEGETLFPRQPLSTVPYSFRALWADSVSGVSVITYIDSVNYIDSIAYIDSIVYIDSLSFADFISYIDSINHIDFISYIDSIGYIDSITWIDSIGWVGHTVWADSAHWAGYVHWDSIDGIPGGFSDGVDNEGITSIESQTGPAIDIATAGTGLSVAGAGNVITFTHSSDGDNDANNELQTITGSGTSSFTLSDEGGTITLNGTGGVDVTRSENTLIIDAAGAGEANQTIITGAGVTGAESPGTSGNFTINVGEGWGISTTETQVSVNQTTLDGRYALSSGNVTGSGNATRVAFWNTPNTISSNANLYWDNSNNRLGIGTGSPSYPLHVIGDRVSLGGSNTLTSTSANNIAIGSGINLSAGSSAWYTHIGIGYNADVTATSCALALGYTVATSQGYSIVMGINSEITGSGTGSHVIGNQSSSTASNGYTFGSDCDATATQAMAIGYNVTNDVGTSVEIGASSSGTGIFVNSSNNVGIGTTSPTYKLHVSGRIKSDGINETSDARFKKNVQPIENALEKALALQGITFEWNQEKMGEDMQLGLIAQDVEKILPEVVNTDEDGYKSIRYSVMVALLIEALKEQQAEQKILMEKIYLLEDELHEIKERLE
ncbi:tail fiber domain-containing protein [bacterium]|nr:tail fiber domain-containing protein [bacterium]